MSELKPYPFCGGEAKEQDFVDPPFVYCTSCGGINKSVEAWNRRPIYTDIAEAVKQAIRDLCEEEIGDETAKRNPTLHYYTVDYYTNGERTSGSEEDDDEYDDEYDDEDDEEDLLEGDLEDQFEKLMGGDI